MNYFFYLVLFLLCVSCANKKTEESLVVSEPNESSNSLLPSAVSNLQSLEKVQLALPNGKIIQTYLAVTEKEKEQGLSGLQPSQFDPNEGMFFYYSEVGERRFWMPDTYFDLDIFFLDSELKVLYVERKVPFHPGRDQNVKIPTTKTYVAHYVLELKSSDFSKELNVGDKINWISGLSLEQIKSKIHP